MNVSSCRLTLVSALLLLIAGCSGSQGESIPKVFKHAGGVQCENNDTPVEVMQRELTDAGIPVQCGQRAGDGFAYPACCGCAHGLINVYTIDPALFAAASDLGFQPVATLPDYVDAPCP